MAANVLVYTTSVCPYCMQAKSLLKQKKVSFTEINVEGRDDLRAWLAQRSKQTTVPQVFANGQPLGGFSDLSALDRAGKLDSLLAKEPSVSDAKTET